MEAELTIEDEDHPIQSTDTDLPPADAQPARKPNQAAATMGGRITDVFLVGISYFIDYLRWTQLTPMILVWGFFLVFVVLAGLLNFQDESLDLGLQVKEITAKVPGLNEKLLDRYMDFVNGAKGAEEAVEGGATNWIFEELQASILQVWAYLSLFLLVLGIGYRFVFKRNTEPEPASLRRKLSMCAIAIAGLIAVFSAISFFSEATSSNENPTGTFLLYGGIIMAVSAYSLTVSHLLGRLSNWLCRGTTSTA